MAGVARSWCGFAKFKVVSRTVGRLYFTTDLTKTDRLIDRVKRFVFGEKPPPEEKETVDSYYQLVKTQDPSVYSMETHEIVNKLEHIVTDEIPNIQEWQNQSVQDLVVKYKVLNRCYEEFGLLVPNFKLNEMNTVQDVINFYISAKPKDTRTFKSIDTFNLPPNLSIGGSLPFKNVSK